MAVLKNKNPELTKLTRRDLLNAAASGGVALSLSSLPGLVLGQESISVTPLRNNISLLSKPGWNVLLAVGSNQSCIVDGAGSADADNLLQQIEALTNTPLNTLFNSNWRPHHCGLNYKLGPAGADIIAHENTRLWQNNDFVVDWEDQHYAPLPKQAQANLTFYKNGSLDLGNEMVDYGRISEFHTDGDIYIRFQQSNILFVGDMLGVNAYPLLDYITGGWIGGAQKCTAQLLEMCDDDTLIIPASGPVQHRAALEKQQQMLDHAYEMVANAYRTGRSLDQFMASAPMADYDGTYGNSELFTELLYRGTWYHVPGRAIRGII